MTEKRAKKSAVDTEEQKANEALRRKAGKVLDFYFPSNWLLNCACIRIQHKFVKKCNSKRLRRRQNSVKKVSRVFFFLWIDIAETKLWLDKLADAAARAKIKAQIEADKKARAEKVAAEKAAREGQTSAAGGAAVSGSAAPAASTAVAPTVKKEYLETRLQVRYLSMKSLAPKSPAFVLITSTDTT
jgi:hypothetical protein